MPEQPRRVQLEDGRYYSLPVAREYVCLIPKTDRREACIRLRLLNATTLDIPLTRTSLEMLMLDLRPYLENAGGL